MQRRKPLPEDQRRLMLEMADWLDHTFGPLLPGLANSGIAFVVYRRFARDWLFAWSMTSAGWWADLGAYEKHIYVEHGLTLYRSAREAAERQIEIHDRLVSDDVAQAVFAPLHPPIWPMKFVHAGFTSVADLRAASDKDLRRMPNVGAATVAKVRAWLETLPPDPPSREGDDHAETTTDAGSTTTAG